MTGGDALPTEIVVLAWSLVLLFVQIFLQSGLATWETGLTHNASARDDEKPPAGKLAGRAKRALANYLETLPAFLGLALALTATGRAGGAAATGALVWLVARCVYVPLYLAGVPYIRSFAYLASLWGLWLMFKQLVF